MGSRASNDSSGDSDLSDDALMTQIHDKWGEQESELRQALFFQFTKAQQFSKRDSFLSEDRLSQYDRMLDHESIHSADD